MKVVFLETVEGSGAMGEVRDVARGYARNYLLPRGLAAPATPSLLRRAEELTRIETERQRLQDEQARELVGKLADTTLVVAVRVGEQGRLYGSVTNVDVAEKAGEILGEELDRRRILLPEVIRQVGLYAVPIRLSRNVTSEVRVAVVNAEAPEGVDAAVQALLAPPETAEDADGAAGATDTATESAAASTADNVPEPGNSTSETPEDEDASTAEDVSGESTPSAPSASDESAPDDEAGTPP